MIKNKIKATKEQWLRAIWTLREYYKKRPLNEVPHSYQRGTAGNCPLCVVAKEIKRVSGVSACNYCLWMEFEGGSCMGKHFHLDTTQHRLDRLDRWEELLKKEELN